MTKNEKGYTIFEMVISLAIFSIVSLLVLLIFNTGSRAADLTYTQSRVTGEARMGIDRMSQELRNSACNNVTVLQADSLQFTLPQTVTSDGVITWSGPMRYNLGGINGQQLLRQDVNAGTTTVIANEVTGLQFVKNVCPTTLTINITTRGQTTYGIVTVPVTLNGTVKFRN